MSSHCVVRSAPRCFAAALSCAVSIGALAAGAQDDAPRKPEAPAAAGAKTSDAAAVELVRKLWDSMGGKAAWDAVAVLQFDAIVETNGQIARKSSWLWDRAADRFRLEMKTNRGTLVALYDGKAGRGVVLENGKKVADSDHDDVLSVARDYFAFDTNGLLLPWRLMDPGVRLTSLEPADVAGRKHPRIEVTFEPGKEIGPGSKYVLTLDPVGHRLVAVEMTVPGAPPDAEPMKFAWIDWVDVGALQFCVDREGLNNPNRLSAQNVATPERVPDGAFDGL